MRIPLRFDVGFGDIITPGVRIQKWVGPLDYEDVSLITYPMETVVAEKLESAVSLGINNSRMKDLFDLHWLQAHLEFNRNDLTKAITNTFARRSTCIPNEIPVPFTDKFKSDAQKIEQWSAFLHKGKLQREELSVVLDTISEFLLPVLQKQVFDKIWTPTNKWNSSPRHS